MRRIRIAACVALVVVVGCQPRDDARSKRPAASGSETTESKVEALEQNAAADGDKAAPSHSEMIKAPEAQAVDPVGAEPLDDPLTCLARSIYWEARGEGEAGMETIASVVMNRLGHEGFPNTVCGVVKQGQEQGSCQFSWWCDGRPDRAWEDESYATAKEVARKALNLQLTDRTGGALYFHQHSVSPSWSNEYEQTAAIAGLVFYKPRRGDSH